MTATIYQLRDYQSKADLARMYGETTMEQQAIGILDYVNGIMGVSYGGAGIDGMTLGPEAAIVLYDNLSELYVRDPIDASQANALHRPDEPA